MAKNLFNRYIWLLDTINSRKSLSFEKINAHWRESPLNDDGKDLPIRTFHNHKSTIEEEFGLNIVCDRSTNEYYIINLSDLKGGNIKNWILESLAVHNVISEQIMLKDRIVMESIPSSYKYLAEIIESMKRNRILFITYRPYTSNEDYVFEIKPYAIKLFRQIWYVAAYNDYTNSIRIYSLDWVLNLSISEKQFELPKDFSSEVYFNDYFGVMILEDIKLETVLIKVYKEDVNYIRSLLMHHSQKEIETKDDYSIFQFKIKPTYDFKQAILARVNHVEVISPESFRKEIKDSIDKMAALYKN